MKLTKKTRPISDYAYLFTEAFMEHNRRAYKRLARSVLLQVGAEGRLIRKAVATAPKHCTKQWKRFNLL